MWLTFLLIPPLLVSLHVYTQHILPYQNQRKDLVELNDPFHHFFPLFDATWPITFIEHGCHVWYIICIFLGESEVNTFAVSFMFIIWVRSFMLYITPLKVPPDMILLNDPIQKFFIRDQPLYVQDLFFSGHMSVCMILGLTCPAYAWWFYGSACIIAILMMCARIHYTIDLVAAPFITYSCYTMARALTIQMDEYVNVY